MPYESLRENFRFLVIEVEGQIQLTSRLLLSFEVDLMDKIASKDDYIDNLKSVVEKKCFSRLTEEEVVSREDINALRAIHIMSVNLERIGDFCVNIARQTRYLSSMDVISNQKCHDMFETIEKALERITSVFETRDLSGALAVCRAEYHLDNMFKDRFDTIMDSLRQGNNVEDLVTALFIFRYLERIGDALLNVGEALLFAIKGEKLKIEQYESLRQALCDSKLSDSLRDLEVSSILGSRSGCRISRIQKHGNGMQGIFKEGARRKIKREYENMQAWEAIWPDLVPKIFGYHENNGTAAIIVEYIQGVTLDEIILKGDVKTLNICLNKLMSVMADLWRKTCRPESSGTDYMNQLQSRLDGVLRVHPSYCRKDKSIGSLNIPSTKELMEVCVEIEAQVPSTRRVFIHGDFNVNNVFYDSENDRIRYIDLYRSRYADYVQDASVFLVSNYRLPFLDSPLRPRLNRVIEVFVTFFKEFAEKTGDHGFDVRMTLALIRSFYTSTRFELNPEFSRRMYLNAHFLMESLSAHEGPWDTFNLPEKVLYL